MGSIQRADIERVVELLDKRICLEEKNPQHLSWKTASNVWTLITKMFDDAVNSKNRSLRVRTDDPSDGVRPPERGDAKAKQFLYPSEFLKLVSCDATSADARPLVPLRFRILYAAATYTFARRRARGAHVGRHRRFAATTRCASNSVRGIAPSRLPRATSAKRRTSLEASANHSRRCPTTSQKVLVWFRRFGLKNLQILERISGAKGDRTPDLCIANAALSQLSYCPRKRGAESHAPPV